MAEPPLSVDPEGVPPEIRRVGTRWIDLSIAGAAIEACPPTRQSGYLE